MEDMETMDEVTLETTEEVAEEEETAGGCGLLALVFAGGAVAGALTHKYILQPAGKKVKTLWAKHKAAQEQARIACTEELESDDEI